MVTIYRGLNADLAGVELSSPYETSDVELDRLSDFDAGQGARGHRGRQPRRRPEHRREPRPATVRRHLAPAGRVAEMSQTSSLLGFVHRRRRGAELFLLVLALAVGVGAYAAVGLGVEGEVPRRHRRRTAAGWPR